MISLQLLETPPLRLRPGGAPPYRESVCRVGNADISDYDLRGAVRLGLGAKSDEIRKFLFISWGSVHRVRG